MESGSPEVQVPSPPPALSRMAQHSSIMPLIFLRLVNQLPRSCHTSFPPGEPLIVFFFRFLPLPRAQLSLSSSPISDLSSVRERKHNNFPKLVDHSGYHNWNRLPIHLFTNLIPSRRVPVGMKLLFGCFESELWTLWPAKSFAAMKSKRTSRKG